MGERWSWIDKRPWTDEQWKEYGLAPELRTFGAYHDDSLAGYYELRRDNEGGVEIAYFGLLPDFLGRGLGGALLTNAIEEAWRMSPSVTRVWVHTCTRRSSAGTGQLPGQRNGDLQGGRRVELVR